MQASAQRLETAPTAQFREIKSIRRSVFISEHEADYTNSIKILADNGLRSLTYQEALTLISETPELKDQLKGKWFYLDGKGLKEKDGIYTFDEKGSLEKITGKVKPSREKSVCVCKGIQQLCLCVDYADLARARFYLTAYTSDGSNITPVVVGIIPGPPSSLPVEQMAEGAKQNSWIGNLLRSIKNLNL